VFARETIAVVDDTESMRLALRRTLESAGYPVVEGACGADALRIALSHPALLVLDVHMPDMLGPEVVRRLQEDPRTRSVPVLQLSDGSDGADRAEAHPIEPELLRATIRALLRSRAAERAAERALQTRDEFLSITSHDIRGLLHALRLTLDLQLLRAQDPSFDREAMVATIRRSMANVQRMSKLVEDILDRSQLQEGKLTLHLQEADLVALVRDTVQRSAEEAAVAGTPIEVHAPGPVIGWFDPFRVDQIVANLLSNAMKYGARKPITISVHSPGEFAHVRVEDRGPGIADGEHDQVFERFERCGAADRSGGYGLGLWIVRELARLHGGAVTLQSAPGGGASFTVTLPLGPVAAASVGATPERPSPQTR
jgi:signal transduction histidine kinase